MAQAGKKQPSTPGDGSRLSAVVERNIHMIENMRRQAILGVGLQERLSDLVTEFSGTMLFVYLHVAWFGLWILANVGAFGIEPFDPFPFGFLTMVVSLEAIFLATFVLIIVSSIVVDLIRV